jgi:hypothetical protein
VSHSWLPQMGQAMEASATDAVWRFLTVRLMKRRGYAARMSELPDFGERGPDKRASRRIALRGPASWP